MLEKNTITEIKVSIHGVNRVYVTERNVSEQKK